MPEGPRWILTNSKMNHFIEVITVSKAKTDVDKVFKQLGYHNLTPMHKSVNPVSRFIIKLCGVARILTSVHRGDNLCLQYPMKKFYHLACTLAHLKGAKVITIVHDLDAFRRKKITAERERYLFNKTDALIVHNPTMLEYMKGEQFQGRLYNLQIFDFITEGDATVFEKKPLESVANRGELMAWQHTGFWQCMDTQRDKQKLEDLWASGRAPWKLW